MDTDSSILLLTATLPERFDRQASSIAALSCSMTFIWTVTWHGLNATTGRKIHFRTKNTNIKSILRPRKKPRKKRVSPIHRQLSVPVSISDISPKACVINEICFLFPWTNESKSTVIGRPARRVSERLEVSITSWLALNGVQGGCRHVEPILNSLWGCSVMRFKRNLTSIPSKFREVPLPEPVGTGAMGMPKASLDWECWAIPLITSWISPSPDSVTRAS